MELQWLQKLCTLIFVGFMLCRGKKCMFHRDKELIGCLRRNVEAGGNSFAVFNRKVNYLILYTTPPHGV